MVRHFTYLVKWQALDSECFCRGAAKGDTLSVYRNHNALAPFSQHDMSETLEEQPSTTMALPLRLHVSSTRVHYVSPTSPWGQTRHRAQLPGGVNTRLGVCL